MPIYVKNTNELQLKWGGQYVQPNEYYMIEESELPTWQAHSFLIECIADGRAIIASEPDGSADVTDISEAMRMLLVSNAASVVVTELPQSDPFAKKQLPDGRGLFRRKRGVRADCDVGETAIDMIIPYASCKIDGLELIGCGATDDVDLIVLDSASGAIQQFMGVPAESIIPNLILNQFGFDVAVSDSYYSDSSSYDADLVSGMIVRVVYKNKGAGTKNVGVNFVLHEVK